MFSWVSEYLTLGTYPRYKFQLPDVNKYKIEAVPELMYAREQLARRGLKDPWLRHECWRYYGERLTTIDQHIMYNTFQGGFRNGLLLAIGQVALMHAYWYVTLGHQPDYVYTLFDWLTYHTSDDKKHH